MKFLSLLCALFFAIVVCARPLSGSQISDILEIRQLLNSYAFAVDGKDAVTLTNVFAPTAVADIGGTVVNGSTGISSFILTTFSRAITQHALTTQSITPSGYAKASASTYFTATVFGQNQFLGQVVTAYGKYQDTLVENAGGWKIQTRNLTYSGPLPFIGNVSIVTG